METWRYEGVLVRVTNFEQLERTFDRIPRRSDIVPDNVILELWSAVVVLVDEVRKLKNGGVEETSEPST